VDLADTPKTGKIHEGRALGGCPRADGALGGSSPPLQERFRKTSGRPLAAMGSFCQLTILGGGNDYYDRYV